MLWLQGAFNFELVQPICSAYINVTDGRTDGQTDGRLTIAILRLHYVHRAVKMMIEALCDVLLSFDFCVKVCFCTFVAISFPVFVSKWLWYWITVVLPLKLVILQMKNRGVCSV